MATVAITPNQDVVTGEIFIAAPPARVFQAITDPNQMPQWWGARIFIALKNGRPISASAANGPATASASMAKPSASKANTSKSIPHVFVHTWICSWMGPVQTIVRWELVPQSVHGLHPNGPQRAGTGTLVKIRQQGFAGRPAHAANHSEGWKRVMGWLVAYIEKGETVDMRH